MYRLQCSESSEQNTVFRCIYTEPGQYSDVYIQNLDSVEMLVYRRQTLFDLTAYSVWLDFSRALLTVQDFLQKRTTDFNEGYRIAFNMDAAFQISVFVLVT